MRQWALGLEVMQRVEDQHAADRLCTEVQPYVAISRDTGAGAGELARCLGEELGWEVLNKELLECLASRFHLDKAMVEIVDETTRSWLLEMFGKWMSQHVVTQTEYIKGLGKVLVMAARHAHTVFVGRGAQFILPRERGLAVQILAPLTLRLEHVMQREKLSIDDARRYLKRKDRERRDFVREHFGYDVTDPHLYDLVVNLEHISVNLAVELIAGAVRKRFALS
jgi:cytidylate kinase